MLIRKSLHTKGLSGTIPSRYSKNGRVKIASA